MKVQRGSRSIPLFFI